MANNDVELSLRITADAGDARESISALSDAVKETSNQTFESNNKSAKSWSSVLEAQNEAMRAYHASLKAEEDKAKAQEKAQKATKASAKETQQLRQELDHLLGSIDPVVRKLSELDAKEEKLRSASKKGLLDKEAFDDYLGKINEQREAIDNVEKLSTHTKNVGLNTRTARREMFSLLRGVGSGNFSLIGNNLFQLGNATGKLPPLFSLATLSLTAFAAAAYGFFKLIKSIQTDQDKFNKALASTGNYAGTTSAGLESMSKSVGKIAYNYGETRQVIAELAEKGDLSASSIKNIATASAYMAVVTGKNAKEIISSFKGIQESASNWASETNKQYHFLDLATFNRITALELQGKKEEAIALATNKYADEMQKRATKMKAELNWLESAWDGFKNAVSVATEEIKGGIKDALGLSTLNEEIENLEKIKNRGFHITMGGPAVKWNVNDDKKLNALKEQKRLLEANAQLERSKSLIQEQAITAQKELSEYWNKNKTDIEKQNDAVEKIRKQYEALWKSVSGRKELQSQGVSSEDGKEFTGGQYDVDVKFITDSGLKQHNNELKKSLEIGKEKTELAKIEFEINKGKYQNASKGEKEAALLLAKQVDAMKAKKALQERLIANDKANLALQKQLHQMLYGTKDNEKTTSQWHSNLLTQFKKAGNQKGIDLIDQLLPLKKAEASLNEITTKIQQIKAKQASQEQIIQAQVINGTMTQIEAQSKLVEIHKQTANELKSYVPLLNDVSKMPGEVGRNGQKAVSALNLEVANLNKTTNALTDAFKNGLQNGISSSLKGLADGTQALNDVLKNLTLSIINSMADIAAQGLSQLAMDGINAIGSADSVVAATEMSTAITTSTSVGAGEIGGSITASTATGSAELSGAIAAASGTGAATLTSSLTAAFTAGATAIAAAITTASAGSAGVGAAGAAFATGGYVSGAGTGTSDSIPARLSNGEYVINAAAVRRIGVGYLNAINNRKIKPFSTGGVAGNAPKLPSVNHANQSNNGGNTSIQQTLVLDSGEVMESGINSLAGKRSLITFIRANSSTIKQIIG